MDLALICWMLHLQQQELMGWCLFGWNTQVSVSETTYMEREDIFKRTIMLNIGMNVVKNAEKQKVMNRIVWLQDPMFRLLGLLEHMGTACCLLRFWLLEYCYK